MIRPSVLIEYMRDHRSSDTWAVDYGSNLFVVEEKSQMPLPCFYVELSDDSADVISDDDFLQLVTINIRVRLKCRTQQDRMGRTGTEVADQARLELWKILLNKKLDPRFNEVYYRGGGIEKMNEALYYHVFNFFFTAPLDLSYLASEDFDDLESVHIDYDLVESSEVEKPNAQDLINTFQD